MNSKNKNEKSILFISTHSFATNPRLVKEIELALKKGFKVSVICFRFENWSLEINEAIKSKFQTQINYFEIPGNRKPIIPWILSSSIFTFSKVLLHIFPTNACLLSMTSNKRSWLLLRKLKSISGKYDWMVAHNIGSMYPAIKFRKKFNAKVGIDLEDYHPGETNDAIAKSRSEKLIKYLLPKADYITAASAPILKEYKKLVPFNCTQEVVMNYFPKEEFVPPVMLDTPIFQLVWFSQNISYDRGLEAIIPIVDNRPDVELHLYGNCKVDFFKEWIEGRKNIFLHAALPQAALHKELSLYDAGLAIEPGRDQNNELAVSNKILAYYQAGLYIIASDTIAQSEFLKLQPHSGIVLSLNDEALEDRIDRVLLSLESIRSTKQARYYYAWSQSWETESEKLLELWKGVG
ncbi:MAG: hypothetical protein M9898_05220 [Chitinophagaceae bacterium]|nr:hypothetical protein [Chitinophagaceae bacterium]